MKSLSQKRLKSILKINYHLKQSPTSNPRKAKSEDTETTNLILEMFELDY